MIASPPSAGALNATIAEFEPRVRLVIEGASGAVTATKSSDGSDAALSPTELVATTVQEYVLPLVSALTVIGELVSVAVRLVPPSLESHATVYPVIALPPSALASNATVTVFCPMVTPEMDGASGTVGASAELGAALTQRPNTIAASATSDRRTGRAERAVALWRDGRVSLLDMLAKSAASGRR